MIRARRILAAIALTLPAWVAVVGFLLALDAWWRPASWPAGWRTDAVDLDWQALALYVVTIEFCWLVAALVVRGSRLPDWLARSLAAAFVALSLIFVASAVQQFWLPWAMTNPPVVEATGYVIAAVLLFAIYHAASVPPPEDRRNPR